MPIRATAPQAIQATRRRRHSIYLISHPRMPPPMAMEAACLSPSLAAAAFLARLPPRAYPFSSRRRLPLWRHFASASPSGGDGRAVALSSAELRKRRGFSSSSGSNDSTSGGDEKLRSLRRLFSRPDIAIDAYIVPSQDAHQVFDTGLQFMYYVKGCPPAPFRPLF
jgi:hypothetical protein